MTDHVLEAEPSQVAVSEHFAFYGRNCDTYADVVIPLRVFFDKPSDDFEECIKEARLQAMLKIMPGHAETFGPLQVQRIGPISDPHIH